MKWIAGAAATAAVGFLAWRLMVPEAPRQAGFARTRREDLVSTLVTNGRVEPAEFAVVRAPRPGALTRVMVERGQVVRAGHPVAEMDASEATAEAASAEARLAAVKSERAAAERGASPAVFAEIESSRRAALLRLETARRDLAAIERLVAKDAAARSDVNEPRDRIAQAQAEMAALDARRAALRGSDGLAQVDARIREARVALDEARRRIGRAVLLAPAGGVVYNVGLRTGAFAQAGDLIAEIGKPDRLRALILIDEPELGRVALGMPVKVAWSGLADASWDASIEKLPAQVAPSGSRQVGEAWATLINDGSKLPPGANVDVEIRTGVKKSALTIPRGAVRREEQGTGVWALAGDRVEWRRVELGAASVTRVEVMTGLRDGDAVALAADPPLRAGERVTAVFPEGAK